MCYRPHKPALVVLGSTTDDLAIDSVSSVSVISENCGVHIAFGEARQICLWRRWKLVSARYAFVPTERHFPIIFISEVHYFCLCMRLCLIEHYVFETSYS